MTEEHLASDQVFRVGEVAVMCNAVFHTQYNGMDCTVTGPLTLRICRGLDGTGREAFAYTAIAADGHKFTVRPHMLRKKRPPARCDAQQTTWDKCLWQPKQVRA